jgi:hypothetical protein
VAPTSDGAGLEISSTTLALDHATVMAIDKTQAMITSNAPARTVTWSPSLSGTTARGQGFTSTSEGVWQLTWTAGQTCIASEGASQATVAGTSLLACSSTRCSSKATALTRCDADCPTAGTLVITSGAALSDILSFNGKDVGAFTTTSGTNDIQLACGL